MGPQNKSDRRSTKGVKHQSLCNDIKERKGFKPMVGQTTQSRINCRIKVKICGTLLLYSEERRFITTGSRLQETQSGHNKGQNAIISDWGDNQQTQGGKILQQIGPNLRI